MEEAKVPMWLFQRACALGIAMMGALGMGLLALLFMIFDLKIEMKGITSGIQVAGPKVDDSSSKLQELIGMLKAQQQTTGKTGP